MGGDNPVDPGPKEREDGDHWRALPLPLHERQGSPRATGEDEGDTAGQECRASKAVAHACTLTYVHPRTCVQSVLHGLALYATMHRTPHAAQHTLASFVLSPSHHPLLATSHLPPERRHTPR